MTRVFLSVFIILLSPLLAFADGGFVWRNENVDIHEPEQKALLVFENGIEELVLEVKFEGAPEDFGWIVPLPSMPEMKKSTPKLFEFLSQRMQDGYFGKSKTSSEMLRTFCLDDVDMSVSRHRVGIYDVALLEGQDPSALRKWLKNNGFKLRGNANEILAEYQANGWVFAAMKIVPEEINRTTKNQLANGKIQPMYFRFKTDHPVFPLKISAITGHPSTVLLYTLAKGGLVPKPQDEIEWQMHCRVNLPYMAHHQDWLLKDLHSRYADNDAMVLIKNRAEFNPEQMEDITFESYSAADYLASDDQRQRAEACTYLGHCVPDGAVELLVNFLKKERLPRDTDGGGILRRHMETGSSAGQDVRSALWALGEVVSRGNVSPQEKARAMEMCEQWIGAGNIWAKLEALSALIKISDEVATSVCFDILMEQPVQSKYSMGENIVELCADQIFAFGGKECIAGLRSIVDEYYDPRVWEPGWLWRQGDDEEELKIGCLGIQMAAACGDSFAFAELERVLIETSEFATWRAHFQKGERKPYIVENNMPRSLVPAVAILRNRLIDGKIVDDLSKNLKVRPEVRDALFRSVALSSRDLTDVAPDYRAVLISHLDEIQNKDEDVLLEIWDRALVAPTRIHIVMREELGFKLADVVFNPDALAVSYALGAQGRIETLDLLWEQTSWEMVPEKASLAMGYSLTKSKEGVGPVLEYVKHNWGIVASREDFLQQVEDIVPPTWGWPSRVNMDLKFRMQTLNIFLFKNGGPELMDLVMDSREPAGLRLYFLLQNNTLWHNNPEFRKTALLELRPEFSSTNILARIDFGLRR